MPAASRLLLHVELEVQKEDLCSPFRYSQAVYVLHQNGAKGKRIVAIQNRKTYQQALLFFLFLIKIYQLLSLSSL